MSTAFSSVTAFSSDESDEIVQNDPAAPSQAARGQKRRRRKSAEPTAQASSSVDSLRAMLGNPKCHCARGCLSQFTGASEFSELSQFRQQWAEMHKLDQDHEETKSGVQFNFLLNVSTGSFPPKAS